MGEGELNEKQLEMCTSSTWDFSGLSALFLNCTRISRAIMEKNGVSTETIRPVDYDIASGVYPDMAEQGWEKDEWPEI